MSGTQVGTGVVVLKVVGGNVVSQTRTEGVFCHFTTVVSFPTTSPFSVSIGDLTCGVSVHSKNKQTKQNFFLNKI